MPPKLSIITVNLNNLTGLQKTMQSVFEQTFTDYEYIIIDGGSTDGSKEYIEQYSDKLDYWVSEKDGGIYNAMNKGILRAKGEYCLFLNSGDHLLDKNSLLKFEINKNTLYDIIYADIQVVNQFTGNYIKKCPDFLKFSFFVFNTLPHQSTVIRKTLFDSNLYNEELKIVSDWEHFMLSVIKYNATYMHIPEVISVYNEDGISAKMGDLLWREKDERLEKYFPMFIDDYKQMKRGQELQKNLKLSRAIKLLKKIGLLKNIHIE